MNKVVRYTILPVWILAGIFVVAVAILIITPCAICHCIKDAWLDRKERNKARGESQTPAPPTAENVCSPSAPACCRDEPQPIPPGTASGQTESPPGAASADPLVVPPLPVHANRPPVDPAEVERSP